ncbi:DNA mismatch repair endonuclease MutL [Patescibacteria group bacterium]|nr:DNA mismatch repair endonuclease MutL [Patescibacteria group bacterium]
MTIKILSDNLISQIAAGEVIERPASVVKELVENSIDAGATRVFLEIEDAGMKKIRVSDNGCGIEEDQVGLAFSRHATSKISSVEDLFKIGSLGFRGEALSSIASVSRVRMETKAQGARNGSLLELDGGKEIKLEDAAASEGTDISVLGLFHHTPARKKFMKSERTEYGRIFDMVAGIALAHPEVGLRLVRDGSQVLELPDGQDLKERIRSLFGGSVAVALVPVQFHQSNLLISGFVGKPEVARSSKKYQFVFVNGRAIESKLVASAVKEAFHSLLMHEKYPWFLLNIQIDPQFVDVNVHPRKLEVKFLNQQEVFRAVRGATAAALESATLSPIVKSSPAVEAQEFRPLNMELQARSFNVPVLPQGSAEIFEVEGARLRPVAQIAASYIIAEGEEGLVLIDQHAAHERVRYERLIADLENESLKSQVLLAPLEMDLGVEGARLLDEYLKDFQALGFDLEPFGDSTFLLRAVPVGLEKRDPESVVREIVADVQEEWGQNHVKNVREVVLTYTACRGAVKFGDTLTMSEMEALVRDMEKTVNSSHCPHGRPAVVTLTYDKLEEMFKRRNF